MGLHCTSAPAEPGTEKEEKDPLTHLPDGQSPFPGWKQGFWGNSKSCCPQLLLTKCVQWCWWSLLCPGHCSPPQHLTLCLCGFKFNVGLNSMICALRGEQAQHQQPDAPRRGTKLLQQGREDFVPGDDSFFFYFFHFCCSPKERRKDALPGGCTAPMPRSLQILCSGHLLQHKAIPPLNSPPKHKRRVPRAHPWQANQLPVCPPKSSS